MIGYYVHHHGRGHLTRARAIAAALDVPLTVLSSVPRPTGWRGGWVSLPLDVDDDHPRNPARDPRARGRLHWAPLGSTGLRDRSATISDWIRTAQPSAMVVDVSVEVALLARLHGIPVVTFALPGERTDTAHRLGYDVSSAILATWPEGVHGMDQGLPTDARSRITPVGAIGRYRPLTDGDDEESDAGREKAPGRHALVLSGGDDDAFSSAAIAALERAGWTWLHVGGTADWVDDLWPHLLEADLVVTHAGDGALADVSAARRPAVIVPQDRPHREQKVTGRALRSGLWPAVVIERAARRDWDSVLDRASALDGSGWRWWNDGLGAHRAAAAIRRVALLGDDVHREVTA